MTSEEIEKEIRELKEDIRALVNIEVAHASGLIPAPKPLEQTSDPRSVAIYRTALDRLARRYSGEDEREPLDV
jgi:hypothetical protein